MSRKLQESQKKYVQKEIKKKKTKTKTKKTNENRRQSVDETEEQ